MFNHRHPQLLLVLASVSLLQSGCALLGVETIRGSGVAMVEDREVSEFQQVKVGGALHAIVEPGDFHSVTVEGDDNLVPLVMTDVVGGRLRIRTKNMVSISPQIPLRVVVVCPSLNGIHVSGASDVDVRDLQADALDVSASGASDLMITGVCTNLSLDVSGASEVDLSGLTALLADLHVSGASDVRVVATEEITGGASGASSVRHGGTSNVNIRTAGVADVEPL